MRRKRFVENIIYNIRKNVAERYKTTNALKTYFLFEVCLVNNLTIIPTFLQKYDFVCSFVCLYTFFFCKFHSSKCSPFPLIINYGKPLWKRKVFSSFDIIFEMHRFILFLQMVLDTAYIWKRRFQFVDQSVCSWKRSKFVINASLNYEEVNNDNSTKNIHITNICTVIFL